MLEGVLSEFSFDGLRPGIFEFLVHKCAFSLGPLEMFGKSVESADLAPVPLRVESEGGGIWSKELCDRIGHFVGTVFERKGMNKTLDEIREEFYSNGGQDEQILTLNIHLFVAISQPGASHVSEKQNFQIEQGKVC